MNRFKIVPGKEEQFEKVWREREHLSGVPGFKEFHLVKGKTDDFSYMLPIVYGIHNMIFSIGQNPKLLD